MNKKKYCNECHCLIDTYSPSSFINQEGERKFYCGSCMLRIYETKIKPYIKLSIQEDPDKLLVACINTPPLKLKDLKEKLKKEREERRQSAK